MNFEDILAKSADPKYHLGTFFLDVMKLKLPEDIFQVDAATGQQETYASVLSRSKRLARALRNVGLKPGDVLMLGGRNHLDIHVPYYAAMLNGLPTVGVDPYFKYDEVKFLIKLTEPRIAFCEIEMQEVYERAARDAGVDVKIVTFGVDGSTMSPFIEEFGDASSEEIEPADFDLDKTFAWLVSTSGTTGRPKVAAFQNKTLLKGILLGRGAGDRYINGQHYGFFLSPVQWFSWSFIALWAPLMRLSQLQTSRADDVGHIIDAINEYKPAVMLTSPSTFTRIAQHEKPCDLRCFDSISVTGAKVHEDSIAAVKDRMRADAVLVNTYGQTEAAGAVFRPIPVVLAPRGCCGAPMPPEIRRIKLLDPETSDEVTKPYQPGELCYTGLSFTEYYKNPKETSKTFTADGWIKSGDLLYRDENNYYFFVDRLKQLIKYRNYHVYPNELEAVIAGHPGVLEVCVVGVPAAAPGDGELPAACVVRRPGARFTEKQVIDLVANKLSSHKHLRGGVLFMESLPKNSIGKIMRKTLMDRVTNMRT